MDRHNIVGERRVWTHSPLKIPFLRTEIGPIHIASRRSVALKAFLKYEERGELVKQNVNILVI